MTWGNPDHLTLNAQGRCLHSSASRCLHIAYIGTIVPHDATEQETRATRTPPLTR